MNQEFNSRLNSLLSKGGWHEFDFACFEQVNKKMLDIGYAIKIDNLNAIFIRCTDTNNAIKKNISKSSENWYGYAMKEYPSEAELLNDLAYLCDLCGYKQEARI